MWIANNCCRDAALMQVHWLNSLCSFQNQIQCWNNVWELWPYLANQNYVCSLILTYTFVRLHSYAREQRTRSLPCHETRSYPLISLNAALEQNATRL